MLWKNKILVRAVPPSSFSFRCLHLSLLHHPSPSLKLHSLCWKLSRKWHLACFFDSLDVYVAFQKSQSDSAVHVVEELSECLPVSDVVADEESISGSLIVKAVECSLRSILLNNGWRCIGNGCMVNSCFGSSEEKNSLYAIQLVVQADTNDGFVFVVSPDVVRFNRLEDALSLPMLMIGLSRLLPVEEDIKHMQDVWHFKHGLVAPDDYFVQIQFIDKAHETNQWFPSAFILRGQGLLPAPHTIRSSNVICALESFMKIIEGWDFFGGGSLNIKGACRLGIGSNLPVWTKAGYRTDNHILTLNGGAAIPTTVDGKTSFFKGLLSSQDFRAPKPSPWFVSVNGSSEDILMLSNTESLRKHIQSDAHVHFRDAVCINMVPKFRPLFKGRTHSQKTILSGSIRKKPCLLSDNGVKKTNLHREKLLQSPASKGNATEEKHGLLKKIEMDLNTKENAAMEKDGKSLYMSSKTSVNAKSLQVFLERVPPDNVPESKKETIGKQLKEPVGGAATKDTEKSTWKKQKIQQPEPPNNTTAEGPKCAILKRKAKQLPSSAARGEDSDEKLQKKQMTQQANPSDIVAKVMDCHARDQLGSLTVPELKTFLAARKAKVGGKKEDLIQRIVSILA